MFLCYLIYTIVGVITQALENCKRITTKQHLWCVSRTSTLCFSVFVWHLGYDLTFFVSELCVDTTSGVYFLETPTWLYLFCISESSLRDLIRSPKWPACISVSPEKFWLENLQFMNFDVHFSSVWDGNSFYSWFWYLVRCFCFDRISALQIFFKLFFAIPTYSKFLSCSKSPL